MNEINRWSAAETAQHIRNRDVSVTEVIAAHLDRIAKVNPEINAITQVLDDALDKARELDQNFQPEESQSR